MSRTSTSKPPQLTPRLRQIVNWVVNSVALGTHDDDAEIGVMAQQLGSTPGRLRPLLRKLEEQGYITIKGEFVYPTVAALRWQNPQLSDKDAKRVLRNLR